MIALEPDFHFKPEVELYNLIDDPDELNNLAEKEPEMVATLKGRMEAWITKREKETGRPNPMYTFLNWHGVDHDGAFESSQQAYDMLHIGSVKTARKIQADDEKAGKG